MFVGGGGGVVGITLELHDLLYFHTGDSFH